MSDAPVWFCLRATRGTRSRADHCEFPNVDGETWLDVNCEIQGRSVLVELGIKIIKDRHPVAANMIIEALIATQLQLRKNVDSGLETPTSREMSESPPERVSQLEPNGPKFGWQNAANRFLEEKFHAHWEELPPLDRALLRPLCGPFCSSHSFTNWQGHASGRAVASVSPSLSPPATANVAAD